MNLPQLKWRFDFLKNNPVLQSKHYGIPPEVKVINYPIRLIRYWFMYHFLLNHSKKLTDKKLEVCEIGVDIGQMLGFVKAARENGADAIPLVNWDAVDAFIHKDILLDVGYNGLYEVDLESVEFSLGEKKYDAIILLHVLEHLFKPEDVIRKIAPNLKPGGIMIGGFPSLPKFMQEKRQEKIRGTAKKFGHVSVFSPDRVRKMAVDNGLKVDFLSGAFFMRKKGFFLENYGWWFRFNLWFGALFPSWIGETYWVLRKPPEF